MIGESVAAVRGSRGLGVSGSPAKKIFAPHYTSHGLVGNCSWHCGARVEAGRSCQTTRCTCTLIRSKSQSSFSSSRIPLGSRAVFNWLVRASSRTEPTDEGRQGFASLMGSGDEHRQYDGTFGMARMQTVLIHFVDFVEFHPFSEAGALEVTRRQGYIHLDVSGGRISGPLSRSAGPKSKHQTVRTAARVHDI